MTDAPHPRRSKTFWAGTAAACAGALLGFHLLAIQLNGNFHTVIAGTVYRSAQPNNRQLAGDQRHYGIKTILNLRGANPGKPWYDAEIAEAKRLGITHVDFRMSASKQLTNAQAVELLALMADAPKPLLIHCTAGADRSGLASALYVAALGKLGERAAEAQISLLYGHISLPHTAAYAMDQTWEALEPWLGFKDS